MSISVARQGACALPVFSAAARSRVRALTSSASRHPARRNRAFATVTRAEMEYDYDIFTIGAYRRSGPNSQTSSPRPQLPSIRAARIPEIDILSPAPPRGRLA